MSAEKIVIDTPTTIIKLQTFNLLAFSGSYMKLLLRSPSASQNQLCTSASRTPPLLDMASRVTSF